MTTINRAHQAGLRSRAYARLGLRSGASPAEIKVAYRGSRKRFHPDRAGDEGLATFLSIQAAYEALLTELRGRRRSSAIGPRPPPRWLGPSAALSPTRLGPTGLGRPKGSPHGKGARWYWEGVRAKRIEAVDRDGRRHRP
jgi:hypothetical protein